jgi:DNA-binding NtrC family response regulator
MRRDPFIQHADHGKSLQWFVRRWVRRGSYLGASSSGHPRAQGSRISAVDLLLSDVVMPRLRGPELAETLAWRGKEAKAVLFSGYADGMQESGLQGPDSWQLLQEPFSSSKLLAAIRRILDGGA